MNDTSLKLWNTHLVVVWKQVILLKKMLTTRSETSSWLHLRFKMYHVSAYLQLLYNTFTDAGTSHFWGHVLLTVMMKMKRSHWKLTCNFTSMSDVSCMLVRGNWLSACNCFSFSARNSRNLKKLFWSPWNGHCTCPPKPKKKKKKKKVLGWVDIIASCN